MRTKHQRFDCSLVGLRLTIKKHLIFFNIDIKMIPFKYNKYSLSLIFSIRGSFYVSNSISLSYSIRSSFSNSARRALYIYTLSRVSILKWSHHHQLKRNSMFANYIYTNEGKINTIFHLVGLSL